MPRSASTGVYTAPSNSFNPAVTNTTIGSAAWNATQADYVTALAHTASATRALYPITSQVQDGALLWGGTAGGTADALTITLTPAITAYVTGQVFQFVASAANATTTPTINVNSLGAKSIKRQNGATIQPGDIPSGALVQAAYNGTDFLLTSVTAVQAASGGVLWGGTAGGTADALTLTLTPAIASYTAGQVFQFISSATNLTTTSTININAAGAKTIKRQSGAAIQAGDISAGALVQLAYNGTDFFMTGVTAGQASSLGVILYSGRTSDTTLVAADRGYLVDITSGTFTQTFSTAAGLGSGWWIYLRNSGTGDITLDPNGAETIDGLASFIMYPGEARLIQSDGTVLRSIVVRPFSRQFNASGTFTKPPGYLQFGARAWSGGAAGERSGSVTVQAYGGGGGGCGDFTILASTLGATATVTIGAGGVTAGQVGGSTSLGSALTVYGAGGRTGGSLTNNTATTLRANGFEGAAFLSTTANCSAVYGGSASAQPDSVASGNSVFGGAAGGSLGTLAQLAPAGTSVYGGNGGAASSVSSATAGTQPGGGGGASQTGTHGAGAAGAMRIWGLT
jgi:hypothetical protein